MGSLTTVRPVRARGLRYRYPGTRRQPGRVAIDGLALEVEAGERVALIGPNGSGKTTLVRLLATDLPPTDGTLELLGRPARPASPALRRRIAYAADRPIHWEPLTGTENLRFLAEVRGGGLDSGGRDPLEVARALGLGPVLDEAVSRYSFGMRRRLLLAEVLATFAPLLLLDEPTVGLDPEGVAALGRELRDRAGAGAAVVFATNEVREVPGWATRVLFLHRGRVVADAPPDQLLARVRGRTRIAVTCVGGEGAELAPLLRDGEEPVAEASESPGLRTVQIRTARGARLLPPLLDALLDAGAEIRQVRVREPDLRDVFQELTGVELQAESTPGRDES